MKESTTRNSRTDAQDETNSRRLGLFFRVMTTRLPMSGMITASSRVALSTTGAVTEAACMDILSDYPCRSTRSSLSMDL